MNKILLILTKIIAIILISIGSISVISGHVCPLIFLEKGKNFHKFQFYYLFSSFLFFSLRIIANFLFERKNQHHAL